MPKETQGVEEFKKLYGGQKWVYANEEIVTDFISTLIQAREKAHHQELQKARHDWLREEIVKLEEELEMEHRGIPASSEYNQAFQTIIERYQSELDQLKK